MTLYDNEGNIADQIKEPFGVRTIEIIPQKGLLVNGKKVPSKVMPTIIPSVPWVLPPIRVPSRSD